VYKVCSPTSSDYSFGSDGDSAFEYVLESHLQVGAKTPIHGNMWAIATSAVHKHHLKPMTPGNHDILFTAILSGNVDALYLNPETQHLTCFLSSVFGLSSKLFNQPDEMELARKANERLRLGVSKYKKPYNSRDIPHCRMRE
jgi:mannosyl-oligosaccharide alpha-1,2-mannosidase